MLRLVRRMRRDENGFTLVELLVVAAILALLAGIAIPAVANARNTARDNAVQANQAIVTAALERAYILNDGYPEVTLDASDSVVTYDADSKPVYTADMGTFLAAVELKNPEQLLSKYEIVYSSTDGESYTLTVSDK